jgi:hypothetical protein
MGFLRRRFRRAKNADSWDFIRLLRTRADGPSKSCAAKDGYEPAPLHSITSPFRF